jgi:hypothetical protein
MSKTRTPGGPGPRAKRGGRAITNGKALVITCYPRRRTKSFLVQAIEKTDQSLSAFLIIAALEKIARTESEATGQPVTPENLIPEEEYRELLTKRGGKGKK